MPIQSSETPPKLARILVGAAFLALVARMFDLIAARAVNLLWWDEWDLYAAFMQHASWWQLFRWQHTGGREGISFIFLSWLAQATRWNSKDAAYLVAVFVVLNCVLAIRLKRRVSGPLQLTDVIIPLIFFTPMQYESFLGPSVPAFSSFPVLLVLLACFAWLIERPLARYGSLLVINFLAIYSGYGFFLGIVIPIMLLAEIVRVRHSGRALVQATVALIIALFSLATFFNGWIFTPAAPCFRFPIHPWIRYAWFAALMLANPFRLKEHGPLPTIIGAVLLVLAVYIALRRLWQLTCPKASPTIAGEKDPPPLAFASATLFGFSLLYIAAASIGRLCFGIDAADESRYIVFTSLAFFGFYLESLAVVRPRLQRAFIVLLFAGMLAANFYPDHRDSAQAQYFSETKRKWKACYLQYQDIARCDRDAGGAAYPNAAATHLKEKLDYLKANRLNLFSGE